MKIFLRYQDFCLESIIHCCKSRIVKEEILREKLQARADDDLKWELQRMSHTKAADVQHNLWQEAKKAENFIADQLCSDMLFTSLKHTIFLDAKSDKI